MGWLADRVWLGMGEAVDDSDGFLLGGDEGRDTGDCEEPGCDRPADSIGDPSRCSWHSDD